MGKRKRLGTIITESTTQSNNSSNSSVCSSASSNSSNSSSNSNNRSSHNTNDTNLGTTTLKSFTDATKPTCSICIQPYIRRTFLQPCYHSFCFTCIRQWINIVPNCPLCKQAIDSLVYNIDETNNTFQEYVLHDHDQHYPSPEPPPTTLQDRILPLRRHIYHTQYRRVIYPPVANRFARVHYILPEHIPKVNTFLTREIPAIMSKSSDRFTQQHITAILLSPYEANKHRNNKSSSSSSSKYNNTNGSKSFSFSPSPSKPTTPTESDTQQEEAMTMYDATVIQELGEWLTLGTKDLIAENVARRFIDEVMAFIKSGMDYWTFVATVKYEE